MRIATLSIGDEIICGEVVDTNASSMASMLKENGLKVQRHLTVGDNEADIIGALIDLAKKHDAVIITGGLGPTADDLTANAAAKATGRRLVLNESARAHVQKMSAALASTYYCRINDKQAMIPTKSTLLPNPIGTACGFMLTHSGSFMFFLPGVPEEMTRMLGDTVIPFIQERVTPRRFIRTAVMNIFGPSEPETDRLLSGIASPENGLSLSICVTFPRIRVTLRAESDSEKNAEVALKKAVWECRKKLGDSVFSEREAEMDQVVAELFREKKKTLAVAESCTGGMIAKRITDIPGSSDYFLEGAVTYTNTAKISRLGVPSALIAEHGAVSQEVAAAMARGIRSNAGSSLGIGVTGIAGPAGGTEEKPVGTVFISLASAKGCWTKRFQFSGSRDAIRMMTAWTSLDWLRRFLITGF